MDFSLYDNHYIRRFEQIISTQNDNSNSSNNSTTVSKKPRTPLTPEQRELINAKRRVSALTPEQRERRNSKRRITSLSAEQRERINAKRRVSSLTPEQRECRNSKRRVSSMSQDQREKRNMKRRISSMTPEQRAILNSKRRRNTSHQITAHSQQQTSQSIQHKQAQQIQIQPQEQFIAASLHLDQSKKSDQQFASAIVTVADAHQNHQLTSYDLFRQKIVQYTPQEMELINSLRSSNINININRRC